MSTEADGVAPEAGTPAAQLLRELDGRVLVLTLNRPQRLNALTPELHAQLREAVEHAAHDPEVGALVLTGSGSAFCSGGDLGSRNQPQVPLTLEQKADELRHHGETARLLHEMPKPTVAMLNGVAAGAGLALALACDLRIASHAAILTTAYAKVALSGDLGVSYFLTHLVGTAKAAELLFLSAKLDATEAHRIGLESGPGSYGTAGFHSRARTAIGTGTRSGFSIHEAQSGLRADSLARGCPGERSVWNGSLRPHPGRQGGGRCLQREASRCFQRLLMSPTRQ
jgi:hypothetical protein